MKTNISGEYLNSRHGEEANRILRNCVHCGFCNATCPTYQLLGDELDGPRGRVYLIKQVLEGKQPGRQTQLHLDRCLTCRNCETTCPSGVDYGHLLDIGRQIVNERVQRPLLQRLQRTALHKLLLNRRLFSALVRTGQLLQPLLPSTIAASIPRREPALQDLCRQHANRILLVGGCVQPALKPNIDRAARIVLDRLGIECIDAAPTCCGTLSHHLDAHEEALDTMRKNIDDWLEIIDRQGASYISMTASGCGITISEYARLLAHDPDYSDKARRISELYRDPGALVAELIADDESLLQRLAAGVDTERSIAFHPPCTLQHGMQSRELIEPILRACGFEVRVFNDRHLCCGSAGTYSIIQKDIALQLRDDKLQNIGACQPDVIASANIGCLLHLQGGTGTPVKHWLELLV